MEIQKGLVKYKDRSDIVCTYGLTQDGRQFYFLNDSRLSNNNVIVSSELVEAIDSSVIHSHIGVVNENGDTIIELENKSIKLITNNILLVERAKPLNPLVLEAINNRKEPNMTNLLVTTSAYIKENMFNIMGNGSRFLFNDQFSEASLFDLDGNNLCNNMFYSYIGINKNTDTLYLCGNNKESEIDTFSLVTNTLNDKVNVNKEITVPEVESSNIDVLNVNVSSDEIDGAMMEKKEDVITLPIDEYNKFTEKEEVNSNSEVITLPFDDYNKFTEKEEVNSNSEVITLPFDEYNKFTEKEEVNSNSEVITLPFDEYNKFTESTKENVITLPIDEYNKFTEKEDNLSDDYSQMSENKVSDVVILPGVDSNVNYIEDDNIEEVVLNDKDLKLEENNFEVNNIKNIDNFVLNDNSISSIDTDITKIDDDYNFNNYSYKNNYDDYFEENVNSYNNYSSSNKNLMEDAAKTIGKLIDINKNQKNELSSYKDQIKELTVLNKKVVDKARRDRDKINLSLERKEMEVEALKNKLEDMEENIRQKIRLLNDQKEELNTLRSQVEGRNDLQKILDDANNFIGNDNYN